MLSWYYGILPSLIIIIISTLYLINWLIIWSIKCHKQTNVHQSSYNHNLVKQDKTLPPHSSLFIPQNTHTHTNTHAIFCVLLIQTVCLWMHTVAIDTSTQRPSQENTWDHNAAAAIHAASRMPAHKITMTRSRQKTVLFCISIDTGYTHTHTHTQV